MSEIITKTAQAAAEAAVEAVITKLRKDGFIDSKKISSDKTPFQKTETLLYNYNNFKAAIKDKQAQINYLRKNGYDIFSKSITFTSESVELMSEAENMEERILKIEQSIAVTKHYIRILEQTLDSIKDDHYYDIIRLKYFENLSTEEVAVRLQADNSTINRNKKRLVEMLKIRLFSDEVIKELLSL